MSKEKMTLGQLVDILCMLWKVLFTKEVDWADVSCETAQDITRMEPLEVGRQFIRFLANGCRVIVGDLKVATASFEPAGDLGGGWNFWKGLKDGDGFTGDENRDKVSAALTAVDFSEVEFATCLQRGEFAITGEEKLTRMDKLRDSGRIIYGGTVCVGLYKDYLARGKDGVLERLYRENGIDCVEFFGDILRASGGLRCIPYVCRDGETGEWNLNCRRLEKPHDEQDLAVVSKAPQQVQVPA